MINKILRSDYPDLFNELIEDYYEILYQEHRRGSNFFTKWIIEINEEYFPDFPKWWGFWETNTFIWDETYGYDKSEIDELNRVELVEKIVKTTEWIKVENKPEIEEEFIPCT